MNVNITRSWVACKTSRHMSILLVLMIAMYATLNLYLEAEPRIVLSGHSTDLTSAAILETSDDYISRAIRPYTIHDAIRTKSIYKFQFGVVVYHQNEFTLYYPTKSKWKTGCHKLIRAFQALTTTLRDMNVTTSITQEIVLPISAGDSPPIHMNDCVITDHYPCFEHISPVLHFGSGFVNPVIPGEIILPMPQNDHLSCFQEFAHTSELCSPNAMRQYYERKFEDLTPQLIWRGTDFTYLGHYRDLRAPDFDIDVASSNVSSALSSMKTIYHELRPRWKGVVLTAEAEHDAALNALPWANIKFSHFMSQGKKTLTSEGATYLSFQSNGIPAIGEYMSSDILSRYKYHIDIGGGGGTTWSGTIEKLSLPGLLFHHNTPMRDYFHCDLKPYIHYVPVREDLSDLKEQFDWAETHQEEAKRIADQSTQWVKQHFGTEIGFGITFARYYKDPLVAVLSAYQHVDDWENVLHSESADMKQIMKCAGVYGGECNELDDTLHYRAHV